MSKFLKSQTKGMASSPHANKLNVNNSYADQSQAKKESKKIHFGAISNIFSRTKNEKGDGNNVVLKNKPQQRKKFVFDKQQIAVLLLVLGLVAFGCVMVYSASSYSAEYRYGNQFFFLFKQLFGVVLGLPAMLLFAFVDYHLLKKFKWWILAVSAILLLLVFVPGLGVESYGAKRWVNLLGISIQPSEIAKFALVLFLAAYLSDNHEKIKTFKGLISPLAVAGVLCVLVIIEPSMSVTMCLAFVTFFMLIIGGISKKHTIMFSCCAGAAVPLLILAEPYRMKRLFAFLNPWASPQGEGFQLIQSLYSLGNGGFFGVGLFNSRQKHLFLPFAESDFIFSIIGEELGLFGCLCLMAAYFALIFLLFKIGLNAKDRFGCMLSCGVGLVIAVQTLLNIAVVTGSIPPTGLPLPFISSGGTSVAVFMAGVGVALNVGSQSRKSKI